MTNNTTKTVEQTIKSCTYCSDFARGLDEDGDFTCGDATSCTAITAQLPLVLEESDEDESDEARECESCGALLDEDNYSRNNVCDGCREP